MPGLSAGAVKLLRRLNAFLPLRRGAAQNRRQELRGVAPFHLHDILGRARGDDFAAAVAAFGAEIDHPIGGLDDLEIVLDHYYGIAAFNQFVKDLK